MHIQWYPGHMHKASKEIKESLHKVDLVIEILDARIPYSSQNPMLTTLRGDKPCIKILSKSDLAAPDITQVWQDYLEQAHEVKTLALNILKSDKIKLVPDLCRKLVPVRNNCHTFIHTLVVGIPNVGKSTFINALAGKNIAHTGNEPAVTKRQQRINLNNGIILSDTPGILWPNVENQHSGYRLAATGAIRDTAINHEDVAFYTAEFLLREYPGKLKERYELEKQPKTGYELLLIIGKKRGCLRSGGRVDVDKTAKILLTELRTGVLGKLSLETPEVMEKELAELNLIRKQKAEKKQL